MSDFIKLSLKTGIVTSFKDVAINDIEAVPIKNKAAVKELFLDETRFEFINRVFLGENHIAKPDQWTKIVLTEDWANSYVNALSKSPKPLYVPGHADFAISSKERAIPDGYIIGGLVKDDILYLRNALPEGKSESKKELIQQTIREIKAGMLATSTSDYMKYYTKMNEETGEVTYYATESVANQSNALVEAELTGSDADIILTSFKHDEQKSKGEKSMGEVTNKEMFVALKNQIDSGRLALNDVASSLGVDIMTEKQKTALKRLNDVESKVGIITDFVETVIAEKEKSFIALKEAKIKEKFKDEELVELAHNFFALKQGTTEEIDAEIEKIAGMKVFKTIQGKIAGEMSGAPGNVLENEIDESHEAMEA